MRRREFLTTLAASALLSRVLRAADLPPDLKVTRVIGFDVVSQRSKVAGKNSRLDVHGDKATDRMLRIETNMDVVGIGNCRADEAAARKLLGRNPFDGQTKVLMATPKPLPASALVRLVPSLCRSFRSIWL